MDQEILSNQILAFLEHDEAINIMDVAERHATAERMATHIKWGTLHAANEGDPGGYHAIGHAVLDYWTTWQANEGADDDAVVWARVVRDFNLLVAILDHKVEFEHLLLLAFQGRGDLETRRTHLRGCRLPENHQSPCSPADPLPVRVRCIRTPGCTLPGGHPEPCLSADARAEDDGRPPPG